MLLSGIYDSEFLQPVARIKDNLSIWTQAKWFHYKVEYSEPIPPGPASQVEMVTASGAALLAANAIIAKRIVAILQLNENEFLHLRWFPLDNVEGLVWEQSGQQKLQSRNIFSRVDPRIREWDPTLVTTTFFVIGENRDMNLEVRNPMGYATPVARFQFFGNRMILKPFDTSGLSPDIKNKLSQGDLETVQKVVGQTTWLPADGRQS